MFGFKHTFHHHDGHPLARLLTYFHTDPVGVLINNRMDICWGTLPGARLSSELIFPILQVYVKINDESYNELIWLWPSEEAYTVWNNTLTENNVKLGDEWMELTEVIGPPISDLLGVSQIHIPPMDNITPSDGMVELPFQEVLWEYMNTLS